MVLGGAQVTGYLDLHVAIALVTHIVATSALDTRISLALTLSAFPFYLHNVGLHSAVLLGLDTRNTFYSSL